MLLLQAAQAVSQAQAPAPLVSWSHHATPAHPAAPHAAPRFSSAAAAGSASTSPVSTPAGAGVSPTMPHKSEMVLKQLASLEAQRADYNKQRSAINAQLSDLELEEGPSADAQRRSLTQQKDMLVFAIRGISAQIAELGGTGAPPPPATIGVSAAQHARGSSSHALVPDSPWSSGGGVAQTLRFTHSPSAASPAQAPLDHSSYMGNARAPHGEAGGGGGGPRAHASMAPAPA
ncbi:hypothetical protein EON68_04170, partial [archaeon]